MITRFQRAAARMTVNALRPLCRPGIDVCYQLRDTGRFCATLLVLEIDTTTRHRDLSPPLLLGEWTLNWFGLQRDRSAHA